ncbi:MAG: BatA and WFA domain-containing protein [Phycisphaeraceae bacterium]|nr:BatA and WFA domain-containing protein [Phycisphaeraceae bacterium]
MGFISPLVAAIAAGITIPALVSLYFLKLKRKRMVIPSTLLWQRAVQDLQVNAPFQKIKNNLLLWVQLLLLLLLLVAMARPTQNAFASPGERVVIVIDHSASMNTTDADGESRLEAAKERALEVVANLDAGGGDQAGAGAMVIAYAHRTVVLQDFTTDLARVRSAIRGVEATDQKTHLDSAIAAVEPHARQTGGDDKLYVHVFSDGRVSKSTDEPLALANAEVRYHSIGDSGATSGSNLAIAALSARRDLEKPQLVQVYARLANYSDQAVTTNVRFMADDRVLSTQRVTVPAVSKVALAPGVLPPPGETGLTFDMTWLGDALITISHDHQDLLRADNSARMLLTPSRELRVLMVTTGNGYLELACQSAGIENLVQMTPDQFEKQDPKRLRRGGWDDAAIAGASGAAGEGFDVIVFDRYAPKDVPLINSLYFGVVPPLEGLSRKDTRPDSPANELITQWDRSSELLRNVELSDIPLRRPGRLVVPVDGTVMAIGREGPVMAEVTRDTVRHVVVGFDLYESLWPHRISFPVFIKNVLPTLGLDGNTQEAGIGYHTGENAVVLVDTEIDALKYTGPATIAGRALGTTFAVDAFPRVGLYETKADVPTRYKQLAVNLLDTAESDPRVAEVLEIGTSSQAQQAQAVEVRKEIWPWFVWGALAVLLMEWMVYARRMHI